MAQPHAERAIALARHHGFPYFMRQAQVFEGWSWAKQGRVDAGIAHMHEAMEAMLDMSARILYPTFLTLLAELYGDAAQPESGLRLIEQAHREVEATSERFYEAELYRVQGELLQMCGADTQAVETAFIRALEIARQQEAKSLELRAAMSLARLWQRQGKRQAAHDLLADIYHWFTEGFDTPDLRDARTLLEELSKA